ncbi:MAG: hypothetical protein DRN96_09505 [Thermoproteota archaeon]|nr:MAG: hypothetical protein DRN96_09505 [Candidatus Korarchaeota archaeon]
MFSRFYDSFTLKAPGYREACILTSKLAKLHGEGCVLDVACGTGAVSLLLAEEGREVIGLDLSPGQVNQLKAKASLKGISIHPVIGDARMLPFRSKSFNLATCSGALSEIAGRKHAIREISRVLKQGGHAITMTFNRERTPLPGAYTARELKKT